MDDLLNKIYPEVTLETDDILMTIAVKKDYSHIKNSDERKNEFLKNLNDFIKEFGENPASDEFLSYFD